MADQRITGHAIRNELESILQVTKKALSITTLPEGQRERLRRLQEVAAHIKSQLQQARTNLIPLVTLDSAQNYCLSTRNSLEAFLADNSDGYIETANNSVDQALILIGVLPSAPFKTQSAALMAAADEYAARLSSNESSVMLALNELGQRVQSETQSIAETLTATKTAQSSEMEALAQRLKYNKRLINLQRL